MITELPASPSHHGNVLPGGSDRTPTPSVRNESVSLRRVTFQTVPPLDSTALNTSVLLTFTEPEPRVAIMEEKARVEWPNAVAPSNGIEVLSPDFDCICVDSATAGSDLIRRVKVWIDPNGIATASVLIKLPSGWVRVKPGRVVVCLPQDEWSGALAALADFVFHEHELRQLEREIAVNWTRAETDLPLANDVTPADLARLGDIGAMTRSVWMRRIRLSKLERPFAKCQIPLPPCARKLAARLRKVCDLAERAEILDGQIEVYEYIYEMANQRMGEYGNFRHEYVLEVLIVVLLAAELCVMLLEYFKRIFP